MLIVLLIALRSQDADPVPALAPHTMRVLYVNVAYANFGCVQLQTTAVVAL
jgi:hypothetical protein